MPNRHRHVHNAVGNIRKRRNTVKRIATNRPLSRIAHKAIRVPPRMFYEPIANMRSVPEGRKPYNKSSQSIAYNIPNSLDVPENPYNEQQQILFPRKPEGNPEWRRPTSRPESFRRIPSHLIQNSADPS